MLHSSFQLANITVLWDQLMTSIIIPILQMNYISLIGLFLVPYIAFASPQKDLFYILFTHSYWENNLYDKGIVGKYNAYLLVHFFTAIFRMTAVHSLFSSYVIVRIILSLKIHKILFIFPFFSLNSLIYLGPNSKYRIEVQVQIAFSALYFASVFWSPFCFSFPSSP